MVEATEEPSAEALERAKGVIFKAIEQSKPEPLQTVIQHGFPINDVVQPPGMTCLMLSASMGTAQITKVILQLNPDINAQDNRGRTALHFACRRGNQEIFDMLVESEEIDYDMQTNAGVTPLMMAVQSGNVKLVASCLNNNLNPFLKDGLERTAVDYAQSMTDEAGNSVRKLIKDAMGQWEKQTSEEDRLGAQIEF